MLVSRREGVRDLRSIELKIGRLPEEKGQSFSPDRHIIDTITISQLPQYMNRSFLHQKYVVENLPAKKIALLLGCCSTTIKMYLREFKLSKGGCGKAIHREKLAYGKRIVDHSHRDHKGEGQVIESIRRMYREENLGPVAIARILDAMKVPTKKQGKKWDHSIVIDILKREGIYTQSRKSPQTGGNHGENN